MGNRTFNIVCQTTSVCCKLTEKRLRNPRIICEEDARATINLRVIHGKLRVSRARIILETRISLDTDTKI